MTENHSDNGYLNLLRGALAAHDNEAQLWPPESVEYARNMLKRVRGAVPTLERAFSGD